MRYSIKNKNSLNIPMNVRKQQKHSKRAMLSIQKTSASRKRAERTRTMEQVQLIFFL